MDKEPLMVSKSYKIQPWYPQCLQRLFGTEINWPNNNESAITLRDILSKVLKTHINSEEMKRFCDSLGSVIFMDSWISVQIKS